MDSHYAWRPPRIRRSNVMASNPNLWLWGLKKRAGTKRNPVPSSWKFSHLAMVEMATEGHISDELRVIHQICQEAERRKGKRKGTLAKASKWGVAQSCFRYFVRNNSQTNWRALRGTREFLHLRGSGSGNGRDSPARWTNLWNGDFTSKIMRFQKQARKANPNTSKNTHGHAHKDCPIQNLQVRHYRFIPLMLRGLKITERASLSKLSSELVNKTFEKPPSR